MINENYIRNKSLQRRWNTTWISRYKSMISQVKGSINSLNKNYSPHVSKNIGKQIYLQSEKQKNIEIQNLFLLDKLSHILYGPKRNNKQYFKDECLNSNFEKLKFLGKSNLVKLSNSKKSINKEYKKMENMKKIAKENYRLLSNIKKNNSTYKNSSFNTFEQEKNKILTRISNFSTAYQNSRPKSVQGNIGSFTSFKNAQFCSDLSGSSFNSKHFKSKTEFFPIKPNLKRNQMFATKCNFKTLEKFGDNKILARNIRRNITNQVYSLEISLYNEK